MMVFFDGPDQSKKTTLAKAVAEAIGFQLWERGPYLPHHHGKKYNTGDSIWYVLDDMKTIELLEKCKCNVVIDRHPVISEIVYRHEEGKTSPLQYWTFPPPDGSRLTCIFIILYDGSNDYSVDICQQYEQALSTAKRHGARVMVKSFMTDDVEEAFQSIVDLLRSLCV